MTIRRVEVDDDAGNYFREDEEGDHILMSVHDARNLTTVHGKHSKVIQELRCILAGYAPEQPE
jgi:hypothetical protein